MRDKARAARILAKAHLLPGSRSRVDQQVADDEKVTIRSLRRWRSMLRTDTELANLYTEALKPLTRSASEQFEDAKQRLLDLVVESAEAVPSKSPRALMARTKALAAVAEAQRNEKVLNAWFATNVVKPDAQATEHFSPRVDFEFEVEPEPASEGEVPEMESAPKASLASG